MFKQLILTVVIFIFSISMAMAGCIIPVDTKVAIFTQSGWTWSMPPTDRSVVLAAEQPTTEQLKQFGAAEGQDWTDAVIVFDPEFNLFVLIHKGDLVGECEVREVMEK